MDNKIFWAWLVAVTALILFVIGILMVGGSIYYLDCSRISGQVDCQISTKFLGTFNTEVRRAEGVAGVFQAEECDQDDCQYRLGLHTSGGEVSFSDDFSPDSKSAAVDQINAFLEDSSVNTLRILVVYNRSLIVSVVLSILGAVGLVWSLVQFRHLRRMRIELPDLLEPGEGEAHQSPDLLPVPNNLRLERTIGRLRFTFRHPSWKGVLWLFVGLLFVGIGWMGIQPGVSIIEIVIMSLLMFISGSVWSFDEGAEFAVIVGVIFSLCAPIFIYFGLGTLIDRTTIQVTYDELWVHQSPLPFQRTRRLRSSDIKQLYISARDVRARTGWFTQYALQAVLAENRQVTLVSDLPYTVLHYLEVQVESWLGLKDRRVDGEASFEIAEGELTKPASEGALEPGVRPSIGTTGESTTDSPKRAHRIIAWILGIGCSIPVLCVAAVLILSGFGVFSGTPGDVDENPVWSPDGRYIAFDSNRGGNYDLYLMNADGSEVVQLTRNPYALLSAFTFIETSLDGRPVWSPSGRQIAFVSARDNGMMTYVDYDIFTMNRDGGDIKNLTSQYSAVELRPVWSPDGSRIAFESDRDPAQSQLNVEDFNWDIFTVNSDGSGLLRLTHELSNEGEAAWSPDGSRIAFISDRDGSYDIYTMSSDGSSIQKLTDESSREEEPAWSPDGSSIAFISDRDGDWDIFVMHLDLPRLQKLTTGSSNDTNPNWSPDGKRLAFTSDRDGDLDIYVMNADGTRIVQLTGK